MEINPQDVEHDDIVGDVLIRLLSAKVVEDPQAKGEKKDVLWLQADLLPSELLHICDQAVKSFQQQEVLLEIERALLPIHVVADLHGQISHVLRLLHTIGSPQRETYLFLGDYVDRGVQGIETMTLLFCLKIRYPFQVFLLRGNHEDVNTNLNYGFYEECITRFNRFQPGLGEKIWRGFLEAFNWMPLAALITGRRGRIFCCHGGISPFINCLEDINAIQRPLIIPPYGIACDLVWADPGTMPGWAVSHRGISFVFGQDVLEKFCKNHNIDIVLRGHQVNEKMYRVGYKMNPGGRLMTFFTAPNYMNFKNNGSIIKIDPLMKLTFIIFRVKIYGNSELAPKGKRQMSLFKKRSSVSRVKIPKEENSDDRKQDNFDSKWKAARSGGSEAKSATSKALTPAKNTSLIKFLPSDAASPSILLKTAESKTEKTREEKTVKTMDEESPGDLKKPAGRKKRSSVFLQEAKR